MVDKMGEHLLTNDGATILKMQENRDPIAKMIVEVAKAQEERAFDGTTTCVILLAELRRNTLRSSQSSTFPFQEILHPELDFLMHQLGSIPRQCGGTARCTTRCNVYCFSVPG